MDSRTYGQHCALAAALDVVGERWTMLILRELFGGERRFAELARSLPGLSSALLTRRLRELNETGLVSRDARAGAAYRLTDEGRALGPALSALGAWGNRRLPADESPEAVRDPLWTLQSLAAVLPAAGRGSVPIVNIEVDGAWFHLVRGAAVAVRRGAHPEADASVRIDHDSLDLLRTGRLTIDEAVADGRASIRGNGRVARRVLRIGTAPVRG